ncbi:unnamed protein product [Effrenium voratum]|uniref:Radial spoke head protein 9 homolog n=1 Tax=Effrenium voratum TaxID=2562239 RepID=A0AA36J1S9_9DINO|nr:unnamed protein product [Effrenium voratum]
MPLSVEAMEFHDLEQGIQLGRLGAEASGWLALLKSKEKFQSVCFWGKVFGLAADYYVAFGVRSGDFEFPSKHFFFAGKDFAFAPLQAPTAEEAARILELCGEKPLTGLASKELEPPKEEEPPADDPPDGEPVEGPKKLTEVDRLAQLVLEIDFDTSCVPRGAYCIDEAHSIKSSKDFKGLGCMDALALTSYVHFRAPVSIAALRSLARKDAQVYSPHILDGLDSDQPKGCWALRKERSAVFGFLGAGHAFALSLAVRRNLAIRSFPAQVSGTKKFGGAYFGYAQKEFGFVADILRGALGFTQVGMERSTGGCKARRIVGQEDWVSIWPVGPKLHDFKAAQCQADAQLATCGLLLQCAQRTAEALNSAGAALQREVMGTLQPLAASFRAEGMGETEAEGSSRCLLAACEGLGATLLTLAAVLTGELLTPLVELRKSTSQAQQNLQQELERLEQRES